MRSLGILNIAAPLAFLGFAGQMLFISACGFVARLRPWRRPAINVLIAYVLLIVTVNGVTLRDFWPFSAWPLLAINHPVHVEHTHIVAVDDAGAEQLVDGRAWYPMSSLELISWIDGVFPLLTTEQKSKALTWLLDTAEGARERAERRGSFGWSGQPLGPFTAPYFMMRPHWWAGDRFPRRPLVGLRIYRDHWNIELRERDPSAVTRVLVYDFKRNAGRQ